MFSSDDALAFGFFAFLVVVILVGDHYLRRFFRNRGW